MKVFLRNILDLINNPIFWLGWCSGSILTSEDVLQFVVLSLCTLFYYYMFHNGKPLFWDWKDK